VSLPGDVLEASGAAGATAVTGVTGEPTGVVVKLGGRRGSRLQHLGIAVAAVLAFFALLAFTRSDASPEGGWQVLLQVLAAVAVLVAIVEVGRAVWGAGWDAGRWLATSWVIIIVGAALLANVLPIKDYDKPDFANANARPSLSLPEPLGTDGFGRSELSRVIYGARVSLSIGIGAVVVGLVLGLALGLAAGYQRGFLDGIIGLMTDVLLSFPPLIVLLGLVAVLPRTAFTIACGLGFLVIPTFTRLARANTLVMARREFVIVARSLGASRMRIVFREVLPNVILPVMAYSFAFIALLIVAEGSLSYLGVGIQPPTPTWGRMIADGQPRFGQTPHLVFVPSVVMFMTILAFNTLGEWARAATSRGGV
jgi:peptide/nickel transport system permease protein